MHNMKTPGLVVTLISLLAVLPLGAADDTDTAAMNRLLFFGEFKFCSRGPNHWRAKDTFSLVDSGTKFSVAFAQLLAYFVVHSKPFVGGCELILFIIDRAPSSSASLLLSLLLLLLLLLLVLLIVMLILVVVIIDVGVVLIARYSFVSSPASS